MQKGLFTIIKKSEYFLCVIKTTLHLLPIIHFTIKRYHKISDDHDKKKEWNAVIVVAAYTIPHRLDPLSAEYPKYDHEGMKKVFKVPSRLSFGPVKLEEKHNIQEISRFSEKVAQI